MKVFYKIAMLISCTAVLMTSCTEKIESGDTGKTDEPQIEENKYDILRLGEFPLGLWVTPPSGHQTTAEYKRIRESGINFVNGFMYYENSHTIIKNVLNFCQENGLKYFANHPTDLDNIQRYHKNPDKKYLEQFIHSIKPYAKHPAYAGELFMDEPGKPLFKTIDAFRKVYQRNYPGKIWHVNLFPCYATGGIATSSYGDYISSWMSMLEPDHISYDSYGLLPDGSIIDDYFYNLDFIRYKTRFQEIPFWTFIQTLSIAGTPGVPDKREPSEEDIRWQVWTNLAFGAKGLQYFCYWSPGNGSEQFGEAMIDQNGKKTVRYDYVQKINKDIRALGKVLLKCHAEGVILLSAEKNYKMAQPLYDFGQIDTVKGSDCMVGCFTNDLKENKVLVAPLLPGKSAHVILNFSEGLSHLRIWKSGQISEQKVTDGKLVLDIPAGEAVFVEMF